MTGTQVADTQVLDRTFRIIMSRLVEIGRAPHYTDLAAELGCTVEEGRQALRALMSSGVQGWLHPGTDYIVSLAPLNNLPTQYRISVEGEQKWFAQ